MYLRAYLNTLPLSSSFSIIAIGAIALFALLNTAFYTRLHRTRKNPQETPHVRALGTNQNRSGFMNRHTEERLVEIIRKKSQVENLNTTGNTSASGRRDEIPNRPRVN